MKYTNYIIKGDIINVEQCISQKPGFKQISILILIPVVFMALIFFSSMIPFTLAIDGYRSLKMDYYIYMKKYKEHKYYLDVLRTFDLSNNNLKILLNKGKSILMNPDVKFENTYSTVPFRLRLQYFLTTGSYLLVDKRIEMQNQINRGFHHLKQTLPKLEWN